MNHVIYLHLFRREFKKINAKFKNIKFEFKKIKTYLKYVKSNLKKHEDQFQKDKLHFQKSKNVRFKIPKQLTLYTVIELQLGMCIQYRASLHWRGLSNDGPSQSVLSPIIKTFYRLSM